MYDVAIVGGGICGTSLLYALSRYGGKSILLEKENDVGVGTTKANSAIVHAGYDPEPGTKMARYNVEGNRLIHALCRDLDVPFRPCGSLVLGFDEEDRRTVQELYRKGIANGVPDLRIIEKEELHAMEPNVSDEAQCALYAPSAGVVSPWELAQAQAEVAVQNGMEIWLDAEVQAASKQADGFHITTSRGEVRAQYLVNAAGVHADAISRMLGDDSFSIHPSKGEYFLLDTSQGGLVDHVIFQCPTPIGKGVLVAPTAHGNLIVGPNAEPAQAQDVSTTASGLAFVKQSAQRSVKGIEFRDTIRNFAGLRAVADKDDFIVGEAEGTPGFFRMAGIKSPGLSAAPAMAEDILRMLQQAGLPLEEKADACRRRKIMRFKNLNREEKARAIEENPLYGTIVCRCETVTEGEIVDALHRPLPPCTVDAVKRRCTPGMGRCQGGFCGPRVQAIIARELGVPQEQVPLDSRGSNIITGRTKQPRGEGTP